MSGQGRPLTQAKTAVPASTSRISTRNRRMSLRNMFSTCVM
jgi:hypothetical protein